MAATVVGVGVVHPQVGRATELATATVAQRVVEVVGRARRAFVERLASSSTSKRPLSSTTTRVGVPSNSRASVRPAGPAPITQRSASIVWPAGRTRASMITDRGTAGQAAGSTTDGFRSGRRASRDETPAWLPSRWMRVRPGRALLDVEVEEVDDRLADDLAGGVEEQVDVARAEQGQEELRSPGLLEEHVAPERVGHGAVGVTVDEEARRAGELRRPAGERQLDPGDRDGGLDARVAAAGVVRDPDRRDRPQGVAGGRDPLRVDHVVQPAARLVG